MNMKYSIYLFFSLLIMTSNPIQCNFEWKDLFNFDISEEIDTPDKSTTKKMSAAEKEKIYSLLAMSFIAVIALNNLESENFKNIFKDTQLIKMWLTGMITYYVYLNIQEISQTQDKTSTNE